jgi:hypothetical protein
LSSNFEEGPARLPEIAFDRELYQFLVQAGEFVDLSPERERVAFWSSAIASFLRQNPLARVVPGFRFSAIGFLDPTLEENSFGVVVFVDPQSAIALRGRRRSTQEPFTRHEPLTYIEIEGASFPVFIRGYREDRHGIPCQPLGGTVSCWAVSRRSTYPVGPALLTAGHVASGDPAVSTPQIGTLVQMCTGPTGTVVDVGTPGMDLALVDAGGCDYTGSVPTARALPWDVVTVERQVPLTAQVRFVTDTQGIYTSPLMLVRLLLDKAGSPGDSGALIRNVNGEAVGLYLGAAADPTGLTLGLSADIHQAAYLLDMELFA